MEILGRVNVYLDLLRNENARLSNEIFNLVRLNERILRDVEPLFCAIVICKIRMFYFKVRWRLLLKLVSI